MQRAACDVLIQLLRKVTSQLDGFTDARCVAAVKHGVC
jgi:hypothetical protein